MRNSNQYRKDLRKLVWAENALNCLENSLNISNLNAQSDILLDVTNILEKADTVQKCTKRMLTDEVGASQRGDIEVRMINESEQALFSLRNSLKKHLANPTSKKAFENMDTTDLDSALSMDQFQYKVNLTTQNLKSKKSDENTSSNFNMISRVLFGPCSSTSKPSKNADPYLGDKTLLNTVKGFLFSQNSFVFSNFPLINKSQLQLETSLLAPENNKLNLLLKETNLFPSVQAASPLIRKNQLKEDSALNSNATAKKIAALIGDIEYAFSCLEIALQNLNKPTLISLVLSHYFVFINNKINELDLLATRVMSSIDKQFDQHIVSFLQVFSEVYVLFLRLITHSIPKVIIGCQSHKFFVNEAIKLKTQQNHISRLVGQMLNNLKKILGNYFKNSLGKVIKKDSFCIKALSKDKNQIDSNSVDDIFSALNLKRSEHSTQFSEIFGFLNEALTRVDCTEKWRSLIPQSNFDLQDSCQKMELLVKFNVIGSFLEVTHLNFHLEITH